MSRVLQRIGIGALALTAMVAVSGCGDMSSTDFLNAMVEGLAQSGIEGGPGTIQGAIDANNQMFENAMQNAAAESPSRRR
jgi:hypothetical protein